MRETPVLYFHGFASSPASAKIALLRPLLEPHRICLHTPDLNLPSFAALDFEAMVASARSEAKRVKPRAVVGSSLGALVALSIADSVPLVLIAPGLGIADRWLSRIPAGDPIHVFHHALGREVPIHRAFFEQMSRQRVDEVTPRVPVTVIMGRKDETVPFDGVAAVWKRWESSGRLVAGSKFIELADGDHGLTAYTDVIAREIVEAVS